jgi:hypothetical protein
MKHALAALLVLAACGGDPRSEIDGGNDGAGDDGAGDDGAGDDVTEYRSGTRIRRRMGRTPDGAEMFLGWRDTMRAEDCGFMPAADGVTRCLPPAAAFFAGWFADAQCTIDLALVPTPTCPSSSEPRYALKSNVACGPQGSAVVPLIVQHTGVTYNGTPASCRVASLVGYSFFTVGPALSPSLFQSMTESVD